MMGYLGASVAFLLAALLIVVMFLHIHGQMRKEYPPYEPLAELRKEMERIEREAKEHEAAVKKEQDEHASLIDGLMTSWSLREPPPPPTENTGLMYRRERFEG